MPVACSATISPALPALALVLLTSVTPLWASSLPQPVSPGAPGAGRVAASRCPTFSWSGVPDASGYELAVFRIGAEGEEPVLVTRASVPGDARAFTPDVAQCLERGGRYAWSVAAKVGRSRATVQAEDDRLDWAPAFLFEVEDAPSIEEVEQAIATLERYRRHRLGATSASTGSAGGDRVVGRDASGVSGANTKRTAGAPGEPPSARGARQEHVDLASGILRVASASTPSLGAPSLRLAANVALSAVSNVFKDDDVFLWDDDAGNTALGRNALASASGNAAFNVAIGREALRYTTEGDTLGKGRNNTAVGDRALRSNVTGYDNIAVGSGALSSNVEGSSNVAIGKSSLSSNTTGIQNTAVGYRALPDNNAGNFNTAIGSLALVENESGYHNIAIGYRALSQNKTGGRNIAIGLASGYGVGDGGSNNIFLGSEGIAGDNGVIRIGSTETHTAAFLAGDVALGFSSPAPENRLHVREAINANASPSSHVVQIENTSTGGNADGLAIQVGRVYSEMTPIQDGMNLVTFFDGAGTILGEIQGNGANGIGLVSAGADFAEWLPRLDSNETIRPGDVVGLHRGAVSKRTSGASRVFVVSTAPLVTGNDPGKERRNEYERVAFLGQAPVRVRGAVRAGDLLVVSGRGDGTTIAVEPSELEPDQRPWVVARALEPSDDASAGESMVRALVGFAPAPVLESPSLSRRAVARLEKRLDRLESRAKSCGSAPVGSEEGARGATRRR